VRRRLGLGLDPSQPGITVGQWMDGWLASKRRTRRASTVRMYDSHTRMYIKPVIGDLPLERVNAAHVEQVLAAVPGSAATKHRVLATLRAALSAAVKQRQITFNPCMGVELEPEQPPEAKRWTPAEAARFIRATAEDPMGLLFRIAILNGERRGELCGLRWASVDLASGVLTIERTMLQLGGKLTEGTPKTRAGVRRVYLDHGTAGLLRDRYGPQELEKMLAGEAWAHNDLVFCQGDGRPWNPDHVSKRFKRLAADAGMPCIKLHEARHSANSLMRDAGVDQELRMQIVGHASTDINDRYTYTLAEAHRVAAEQTAAYVLGEDPS
jgi:integrase